MAFSLFVFRFSLSKKRMNFYGMLFSSIFIYLNVILLSHFLIPCNLNFQFSIFLYLIIDDLNYFKDFLHKKIYRFQYLAYFMKKPL